MAKTRIMVVEDERIVALNLQQRLKKLGYDIAAVATSGAQALESIKTARPDVILMDINIEGDFDGIETARRIPVEFHTPVIYLTAYSEQATLDRARETNPYGYLLKPFSERELHATIQMVLARCVADVAVRDSERRLERQVAERTAALETLNQELKSEIEERKRIEEKLHQSQKMEAIGQLTGGIAHDFNNLLQGISGCLTMLQKHVARGQVSDVDHLIRGALSSTDRAATLVHRLLAFSRRQPIDPKPVRCAELIRGMQDLLMRTIGESIALDVIGAGGLWPTKCDPNQLEGAILNLAINARDSMPSGGKLTIETCNAHLDAVYTDGEGDLKPGQYVCIAVTDTGAGMSKEIQSRAFDPFFTTKPTGQGTGLGLSMVYGFARQSEGSAKIYSEVGRGTTVKIYLPRFRGAIETESAEVHPDPIAENQVSANAKVVCVVEDEPIVLAVVAAVVHDLGFQVIEASSGTAALEILKSDARIDLLITDVGLPGLNGRQVADGGRVNRPHLPVLFMTGYAENAALADGFLDSGMQLITKPFALDALAKRVRAIMGHT